MQLHFINRSLYRTVQELRVQQEISQPFQPVYIIPEGGSNQLAVDTCAGYIQTIPADYDIIACACGTGATLAGFIKGLNNAVRVIGFPVLKGGEFLNADIQRFLSAERGHQHYHNWTLNTDYHFGGYGRSSDQLNDFIVNFYRHHRILLEPVYTGKMMFGLYDLIQQGYFEPGSRILAIHSGGLQGIEGFPELKQQLKLD